MVGKGSRSRGKLAKIITKIIEIIILCCYKLASVIHFCIFIFNLNRGVCAPRAYECATRDPSSGSDPQFSISRTTCGRGWCCGWSPGGGSAGGVGRCSADGVEVISRIHGGGGAAAGACGGWRNRGWGVSGCGHGDGFGKVFSGAGVSRGDGGAGAGFPFGAD
jgi:hypothetical protein